MKFLEVKNLEGSRLEKFDLSHENLPKIIVENC